MPTKQEKKAMNERELRFGSLSAIQKREEQVGSDGYYHIQGKATAFEEETLLYKKGIFSDKDVFEIIDRKSFDEADISDVVLNVNHGDGNHAVARTRNKTLRLDIREDGVYISADLDKKNPRCEQFYKDVESGLIDRMSFAFTIADQELIEDDDKYTYRVTKIGKVYDVSGVEFPAYENTSISASRSADLEKLAKELESRREIEEMKKSIREKLEAIASKGE